MKITVFHLSNMCFSQGRNVGFTHTLHVVTVVTIQAASGLQFSTFGKTDSTDRNNSSLSLQIFKNGEPSTKIKAEF